MGSSFMASVSGNGWVRPALWVKTSALPTPVTPPGSISVTPPTDTVHINAPQTIAWEVKDTSGGHYPNQNVTWTVTDASGNSIPGVTFDPDTGKLSVDNTVPDNTKVKVTATSTVDHTVSTTVEVTVSGTVVYDGIKYMVLYQDTSNNRQLIISQDILSSRAFSIDNSTSCWKDSDIREYLNKPASDSTGFLYSKPQLQAALWTESGKDGVTIHTRKAFDNTDTVNGYDETVDKVFFLSEADCFGTFNGTALSGITKDYTVQAVGQLFHTNEERKATGGDENWWWLRSPCGSGLDLTIGNVPGTFGSAHRDKPAGGVRPACWVKINP